jgi:hypothetical protein
MQGEVYMNIAFFGQCPIPELVGGAIEELPIRRQYGLMGLVGH